MKWVVYVHGRGGYLGRFFVKTREEGRKACRALRFVGFKAFVSSVV